MKYLSATSDYGIWYSKDSNLNLVGYSDADWVGNNDDRKSTTKDCFYVGENLTAWMSKKHNSIFFYQLLKPHKLLLHTTSLDKKDFTKLWFYSR